MILGMGRGTEVKVDGGDGVLIVMTLEWREGRREMAEERRQRERREKEDGQKA